MTTKIKGKEWTESFSALLSHLNVLGGEIELVLIPQARATETVVQFCDPLRGTVELEVLFSYSTPVAITRYRENLHNVLGMDRHSWIAQLDATCTLELFCRTDERHSVTTTKHINQYLRRQIERAYTGDELQEEEIEKWISEAWLIPQGYLDRLFRFEMGASTWAR